MTYNPLQPRTAGGQFDRVPRTDPGQLFDPSDDESRAERLAILREHGYVPPVAARTALSPRENADRDLWWGQSFVAAEYGHVSGDYPQMPDDYTPGGGPGGALSGKRRTHRMAYRGADVTLRMPAASAVRRFAAEHGGTFDIPVSAETPDGALTGWVRVSPGADGSWSATALGFDGDSEVHVSEGVAAVLESRRPSRALASAGDLLERRRRRLAESGAEMEPLPQSSWVRGAAFDDATGTLTVSLNGQSYSYAADRAAFEKLMQSDSPGRDYNKYVKALSERVGAQKCDRCGRFTRSGVDHRCPPPESPRGARTVRALAARRAAGDVAGGGAPSAKAWLRAQWKVAASAGKLDRTSPSALGPKVRRMFTAEPAVVEALARHARTDQVAGADARLPVDGVDGASARALMSSLPRENLDHSTAGGPTVRNVLRAVNSADGRLLARGHVVPPSSPHEKVALTGVYVLGEYDSPGEVAHAAAAAGLRAATVPRSIERATAPDGSPAWLVEW